MTLALSSQGSGPPCYLLPANGHDARDFSAVRPALAARFETLALDWPAMGASPPPPNPDAFGAEALADELEELVIARGSQPALFIGHSVGGYAAARLALRRPEYVRGLVLVDSGGFYDPGVIGRAFCWLRGHPAVIRSTEGVFARFHTKLRTPDTEAMFERIDAARGRSSYASVVAAVWKSFAGPAFDLRPLGAPRCPTLLVWGTRDPVVTLARAGRGAARAIPGAQLVTLDTGHSPFVEDPAGFLRHVLPFLEQTASAASPARSQPARP